MTTIPPQVADSERFGVGKAAEVLSVSRNTLLRHTKEGYIRCIISRVNKRKKYTGAEIKRYWNATL